MGKQQSLESALNPDKSPAKKNKKQPKIQDSDDSGAGQCPTLTVSRGRRVSLIVLQKKASSRPRRK